MEAEDKRCAIYLSYFIRCVFSLSLMESLKALQNTPSRLKKNSRKHTKCQLPLNNKKEKQVNHPPGNPKKVCPPGRERHLTVIKERTEEYLIMIKAGRRSPNGRPDPKYLEQRRPDNKRRVLDEPVM